MHVSCDLKRRGLDQVSRQQFRMEIIQLLLALGAAQRLVTYILSEQQEDPASTSLKIYIYILKGAALHVKTDA